MGKNHVTPEPRLRLLNECDAFKGELTTRKMRGELTEEQADAQLEAFIAERCLLLTFRNA